MADRWLDALAGGARVFDLGRPLFQGMPQSPNHPPFRMSLARRHGDHVRADGGSAANEMFVMGAHVGTHIDALSHVSQDGLLHGGHFAAEAQTGGRFNVLGAETISPILCRGVLLDIPAVLGADVCPPAYEVTPDDLEHACKRAGVALGAGDVALVRTGWARHWNEANAYFGKQSGVPGPGEAGATWLASKGIRAAGADTIAFEHQTPGAGHAVLPGHRVLLVEHGIHIIETLNLEELAAAGTAEFLFVLVPLQIVGATGSPVRPLAVMSPTIAGSAT